MKKLVIFTFFLASLNGYAQRNSLDKKLDELYKSDYFKSLDLIITPEMYNASKEENISFIEFFQDSAANFNDSPRVYASIDAGQSQALNYIVGTIGDYQAGEKTANVIIRKVYKDGSQKISMITINFDDIQPPGYLEAEYAQYSIDVEIYCGSMEML